MKSTKTFLILAIFALAMPIAAQVEIDQKTLLGAWTLKKESVELTLNLKKDGKLEQTMLISSPEMGGSVRSNIAGTWIAAGDSITIRVKPEDVGVKYIGSNRQLGDMIEQSFLANREMMMEQMGGKEQTLRNVIVADDLLIFSQRMPQMPGVEAEPKEEKVIMTRKT